MRPADGDEMHTLLLLSLTWYVDPDLDATSQRLLSEVVAGFESHHCLIQKGVAQYTVTLSSKGGSEQERKEQTADSFNAMIYFDGSKARWDFRNWRCVRDGTHDIEFNAARLGAPDELAAPHYIAHIYELYGGGISPHSYHPRWLGHSVKPEIAKLSEFTIADLIRRLRQSSKAKVTVAREGPLIKLVAEYSDAHFKRQYLIDPRQGYSVVRLLGWNVGKFDQPVDEIITEYTDAGGGAFIASEQIFVKRRFADGKWVELPAQHTKLIKATLGETPDPKLFTLDGLGLPRGARIQDKTTGRLYLYGVNAVNEKEIRESVTQLLLDHPNPSSSWPKLLLIYLGLPALILATVLSGAVFLFRRRVVGKTT
jgi:hypothetical protein